MLGCRPAVSPIDVKTKIGADAGEQVDRERYQRLVDRLIYLCHTRPDISFAVNVVSHYMYDPRKGHMDIVYHILRYLKNASGKGLIFNKNGHINIESYCDFNWASCQNDRRSTSGYCMFVGGNLVSWLKRLLEDLKVNHREKMKLWRDSTSVINIANNPVQHDRTKHVEIDRFFIKKKLESGLLKLSHVATGNQIASCLTKGLSSIDLVRLCDNMSLMDIF
jgi:hypothetical protein